MGVLNIYHNYIDHGSQKIIMGTNDFSAYLFLRQKQ